MDETGFVLTDTLVHAAARRVPLVGLAGVPGGWVGPLGCLPVLGVRCCPPRSSGLPLGRCLGPPLAGPVFGSLPRFPGLLASLWPSPGRARGLGGGVGAVLLSRVFGPVRRPSPSLRSKFRGPFLLLETS